MCAIAHLELTDAIKSGIRHWNRVGNPIIYANQVLVPLIGREYGAVAAFGQQSIVRRAYISKNAFVVFHLRSGDVIEHPSQIDVAECGCTRSNGIWNSRRPVYGCAHLQVVHRHALYILIILQLEAKIDVGFLIASIGDGDHEELTRVRLVLPHLRRKYTTLGHHVDMEVVLCTGRAHV